ncbi:hypothetical protein GUJ93_ZPchr0010g8244 [Zizania palustris]|uniref:Uncharacterized protein n=1 Tax=Zizania palustris TaxID=103762 RepID=A0A8J5WAL4_ZIZPA|nr:hypothetical protein GUJ93_ZPchr0010g8244 [Zizania palustris]
MARNPESGISSISNPFSEVMAIKSIPLSREATRDGDVEKTLPPRRERYGKGVRSERRRGQRPPGRRLKEASPRPTPQLDSGGRRAGFGGFFAAHRLHHPPQHPPPLPPSAADQTPQPVRYRGRPIGFFSSQPRPKASEKSRALFLVVARRGAPPPPPPTAISTPQSSDDRRLPRGKRGGDVLLPLHDPA